MATLKKDPNYHDINEILFQYAKMRVDYVAGILELNNELKDSFNDFNNVSPEIQLKSSLEQLSHLQVVKWFLHQPGINLNHEFDTQEGSAGRNRDKRGETLSTVLEQMLVNRFSMESVLHIRNDCRLSAETLFNATTRRDVPSIKRLTILS